MLQSYAKRRDGEWVTNSGADVTKVVWHPESKFWTWYTTGSERLMKLLLTKRVITNLTLGKAQKDIKKLNVYLVKNVDRLYRYGLHDDIKGFENLAKILTKHSKAFRWCMFNNVEPDWMREWSEKKQMHVYCEVQKILYSGRTDFKYKRVWIPKPDGSLRPLAVPSPEWRIVSKWMLLLGMTWWEGYWGDTLFNKNQVGGIRKRNASDGWDRLFKKILPKKNVAEFDIAKCFDTMSWQYIEKKLVDKVTPTFLHNFIMGVIRKAGSCLSESEQIRERNALWATKNPFLGPLIVPQNYGLISNVLCQIGMLKVKRRRAERLKEEEIWTQIAQAQKRWERTGHTHAHPIWIMNDPETQATYDPKTGYKVDEAMKPGRIIFHEVWQESNNYKPHDPKSFWDKERSILGEWDWGMGIPQGWALSPVLTNLALSDVLRHTKTEGVLFLDDGVIGTDEDIEQEMIWVTGALRERGFEFSMKKVRYVKINGKWAKEGIKFLGARVTEDLFQAATRNGAEVKMTIPKELSNVQMGSMNKGTENGRRKYLTIMDDLPFDEVQLAYIYNNGGTYDTEGRWIPMSLERMWVNSWKSAKMKRWRKKHPDKARGYQEAITKMAQKLLSESQAIRIKEILAKGNKSPES